MNIDLKNLTIEKAHHSLKKGEFSCKELAEAYLDVIKEKDKDMNYGSDKQCFYLLNIFSQIIVHHNNNI